MAGSRKKRSGSFRAGGAGGSSDKTNSTNKDRLKAELRASQITNLEMAGDRLKVYSLQALLTNKKSKETRATARLGDVLLPWFEKVVAKPAEKLDPIAELWQGLLPAALKNRTRLVGFSRGTLTVALDSAMVRAELDGLLRGGMLRKLQTDSRYHIQGQDLRSKRSLMS